MGTPQMVPIVFGNPRIMDQGATAQQTPGDQHVWPPELHGFLYWWGFDLQVLGGMEKMEAAIMENQMEKQT